MKKKDVVTLSRAERRAEGLFMVDTGENMNQQIYSQGPLPGFQSDESNGN